MEQEMVTITKKEQDQLNEDSEWLGYLEAAGVDNWEGFDYARDLRREDKAKHNETNSQTLCQM